MDLVNRVGQFLYRVLVGITAVVAVVAAIVVIWGCMWALLTYAAGLVIATIAVVFVYAVGDLFLYINER